MEEPKQIGLQWIHGIGALRDLELRVQHLRHRLAEQPPAQAAAALAHVLNGAEGQDPKYQDLWLAVILALAPEDAQPLRQALVQAALTHPAAADPGSDEPPWPRVARLLDRPSDEQEAQDAPILPVPPLNRQHPPTLGERKSLARQPNRNLVERTMLDPHPDVVRVWLVNPQVTELYVVRLCARRPTRPDILRTVFASSRWLVRPQVRMAIIQNPYCPRDLALQLVPPLTAAQARRVARSPELRLELRQACARLMRRSSARARSPNELLEANRQRTDDPPADM